MGNSAPTAALDHRRSQNWKDIISRLPGTSLNVRRTSGDRLFVLFQNCEAFALFCQAVLNERKFLKAAYCDHREGKLVFKIFLQLDPPVDLRIYGERLERLADSFTLRGQPNVCLILLLC